MKTFRMAGNVTSVKRRHDPAPSIRAAKQATTTIPIVFQTLGDAVAMGFVDNLVRPGGNITGVTGFAPELGGKWLDQLRKVVPDNTHVAVLTNPGNPNTPSIVREIERAARALGVQLHIVERRDPITFEHAFATMTSAQVGALIVPPPSHEPTKPPSSRARGLPQFP